MGSSSRGVHETLVGPQVTIALGQALQATSRKQRCHLTYLVNSHGGVTRMCQRRTLDWKRVFEKQSKNNIWKRHWIGNEFFSSFPDEKCSFLDCWAILLPRKHTHGCHRGQTSGGIETITATVGHSMDGPQLSRGN